MQQTIEKIETQGQKPIARFGHTIIQISKSTCILFGGVLIFLLKKIKHNFI